MTDHIDLEGRTRPVGFARSNRVRGNETVVFEYVPEWLADPDRARVLSAILASGRSSRCFHAQSGNHSHSMVAGGLEVTS